MPDAQAQRRLAPLVSAALGQALREAAAAEHRHVRVAHDEPRLWEGDAFSSLHEGATEARVVQCTRPCGWRARCTVELTHRDAAGGTPQAWRDEVVLARERGHYVVDDIAYGGAWPFANKGTLRDNLRELAGWHP